MTRTERLVVAVATFGFFFDAYELLTLPLILGPSFHELLDAAPGSATYDLWITLIFWAPAVCGGVFGLAGGYLADRFGRRRVLVWSILVYASASVMAALSTSVGMLVISRCLIMVGVCVEFVAGIAWLAEMFSDPRRREATVGFSQAIGSLGGVTVTAVYLLLVDQANALPEIAGGHAAWRYTCLSGVIPAIPLILVRPFLPESPMWLSGSHRQARPRIGALFEGAMRRTTIAAIVATACTYALAYGAMQHLPRLVVLLPDISLLGAQGQQGVAGRLQMFQEVGGLSGRLLLVAFVVAVVARRRMLQGLQSAAVVAFPVTFVLLTQSGLSWLQIGVFFTAALTAAQFSFWGNYLPRVFPTALRATGESFAANVGGRIIGTSFVLATTMISTALTPQLGAGRALAIAAGTVAAVATVIGLIASRYLTEPASERLPD
jgi:MFS family permease